MADRSHGRSFALGFLLIGGVHAFVWGFLVSSVLVWHGSFSINSLAHLIGRRRYETDRRLAQQLPLGGRSRPARGGTTTTTATRARPGRGFAGGRST